jgi:hypothetical protein
LEAYFVKRLIAPLALALLCLAVPAQAAHFTIDSYNVSLRDHDPGLVVWDLPVLAGPDLSFDLNTVGSSVTRTLFEIGTKEEALNWDDLKPYPIDVAIDFSSPTGFGGSIAGITGNLLLNYVMWDGPLHLDFGGGILGVRLSNEVFKFGGSARVKATFTLEKASGGPVPVPEPSTMLLFGIGATALGFRKRTAFSA